MPLNTKNYPTCFPVGYTPVDEAIRNVSVMMMNHLRPFETDGFGVVTSSRRNGAYHCADFSRPSALTTRGVRLYHRNGRLHSEDKSRPAVLWPNGSYAIYDNGKLLEFRFTPEDGSNVSISAKFTESDSSWNYTYTIPEYSLAFDRVNDLCSGYLLTRSGRTAFIIDTKRESTPGQDPRTASRRLTWRLLKLEFPDGSSEEYGDGKFKIRYACCGGHSASLSDGELKLSLGWADKWGNLFPYMASYRCPKFCSDMSDQRNIALRYEAQAQGLWECAGVDPPPLVAHRDQAQLLRADAARDRIRRFLNPMNLAVIREKVGIRPFTSWLFSNVDSIWWERWAEKSTVTASTCVNLMIEEYIRHHAGENVAPEEEASDVAR